MRRLLPLSFVLLLIFFLAGCTSEPQETLSQAYIGPASVNLRSQLNQKNSTVTVLRHGERVTVLDIRRRFIKVRTTSGAEGWVDALDLLSPAEMQRVQRERTEALKLPSEGMATAYETLNIHLDPSRRSPAFAQIPEGGTVSVLARRVVPKATEPARPSIALERPRPALRKPHGERNARSSWKQPPMPPAPKPPTGRDVLWAAGDEVEAGEAPVSPQAKVSKRMKPGKPEKPSKPVLEGWTLVRTKSNQTGWVLSRNLMMAIPDEVAQYAGGKHITSYFELGAINDDRDGQKHNWLWTTASENETLDFDSWRVFLWNRRRHRYETSYRQRDLEGYFPVEVEPADPAYPGRSFKLITKDDDGRFRRRTYLFDGTRVHLTATEDYRPGEPSVPDGAQGSDAKARKTQDSWLTREWAALKQRFDNRR